MAFLRSALFLTVACMCSIKAMNHEEEIDGWVDVGIEVSSVDQECHLGVNEDLNQSWVRIEVLSDTHVPKPNTPVSIQEDQSIGVVIPKTKSHQSLLDLVQQHDSLSHSLSSLSMRHQHQSAQDVNSAPKTLSEQVQQYEHDWRQDCCELGKALLDVWEDMKGLAIKLSSLVEYASDEQGNQEYFVTPYQGIKDNEL